MNAAVASANAAGMNRGVVGRRYIGFLRMDEPF
jgi:hypothetical protein